MTKTIRERVKDFKIQLKEDVPMKKAIPIMLVVLFMASALAFAGQKEKIAVAANGPTLASAVGGQPARSPYFLLFDGKGKLTEAISNPAKDGIAVTNFLAGKGVTVAVAGEYGPRIVEVMKNKGIKAVTFKGSVEEAVKKVLQSK
jgi:predicted Fe-Mo cluster-binding NifX family protein